MRSKFKKCLLTGVTLGIGAYAVRCYYDTQKVQLQKASTAEVNEALKKYRSEKRSLPTRSDQIKSLKSESFDVLIIGGGATGAGCALDAVSRGLKTGLIEEDDFASGTSSRSTKLIHGGVRYLQKAIMNLDFEEYRMVREALSERSNMLEIAPHLTRPLPIMIPVYKWWQIPYYWVGIKMYDFVAGSKTLKSSYYLSKQSALELFPMLRKDELCGAIVYYDGQQDDARMCLSLALTATRYGATIANHVKCVSLLKKKNKANEEIVCGVRARDELTKEEWDIPTKCVINATGPFTDIIRQMDDPKAPKICSASSGVHIVLPGYYSPEQMGLLDPSTSDGRVIFFLPWKKGTIAGTTDLPCKVTHNPTPTENEIMFILSEVKRYLNPDVEVRRGDVLSAWCGIRPLVSDPNKPDTQSLARNHVVHSSKSNLITIAGGKWTTYRAMAEETIDKAIQVCDLHPKQKNCQTVKLMVEGAHGWTPTLYIRLVQDFGLETEVAQHLAQSYGDRAFAVAKMSSLTGKRWPILGKRIHPEFPYIEAEIRYGVKEYACSAIDMIARRLRLAFLNVQAAIESLPIIVDIMAVELNWNKEEKKRQLDEAMKFLQQEMGHSVNRASKEKVPINLSKEEVQTYIKRFEIIDKDRKGYVSINDIRRSLKRSGESISINELHEILKEIDTNMNGQIELEEYLQMMSAIKWGTVSHSRFARVAEMEEKYHEKEMLKKKISVERSGGGV